MSPNLAVPIGYDSIYLRLVDLDVSHDRTYTSGVGQSATVTSAVSPAKLLPIAPFQHWAIQVRNYCYEVTEDEEGMLMSGKPEHDWFIVPLQEWESRCESKKLEPKIRKVGATRRGNGYIQKEAQRIWDNRFKTQYLIGSQNCQNFAELLVHRIRLKPEEVSRVPVEERSSWKPMPRRITQVKTLAKKVGPYLTAGVGLDAAFMTLRAANPVVNAVIGTAIGATLVVPLLFAKSEDSKWKKQMKKVDKILAASEFAEGKLIVDTRMDLYQGYNRESVDSIAESTNSELESVVWALQCFRMPTYDGEPFNVTDEDWNAMVVALSST